MLRQLVQQGHSLQSTPSAAPMSALSSSQQLPRPWLCTALRGTLKQLPWVAEPVQQGSRLSFLRLCSTWPPSFPGVPLNADPLLRMPAPLVPTDRQVSSTSSSPFMVS